MKNSAFNVFTFIAVLVLTTLSTVTIPRAQAIDLLVSSLGTDSVLRYDGTTGAFIDAFVPAGSGGRLPGLLKHFGITDRAALRHCWSF